MATMTSSAKQAAGACPCGCAPCPHDYCDFECLVRPRFFCGQLLTDTDLEALVTWSGSRFRLARHRHGWGVAHGLRITCDPQNPAGVLIQPGYAVDCCGNDIVVCEAGRYSLADLCPKPECFDPHRERDDAYRRAQELLVRASSLSDEEQRALQPQIQAVEEAVRSGDLRSMLEAIRNLEQAGTAYDTAQRTFAAADMPDPLSQPLANTLAVDLFLHYHEQGDEPQAPLRHGARGAATCEDSRVREGYQLSHRVKVSQEEPPTPWDTWRATYQKWLTRTSKFVNDVYTTDLRVVYGVLTNWLNDPEHAPGQFCFAYGRAKQFCSDIAQNAVVQADDLPKLVFWLIVDDVIATLAYRRVRCDPAEGVPLARVWLGGVQGGQACRIVAIDNGPPNRRLLGPDDRLPARPNTIPSAGPGAHLGDLVGRRWQDVQAEGDVRGVKLEYERIATLDWSAVQRVLDCTPESIAPLPGDTVRALCIDLGGSWGERVVGFCPRS
jgi:hypothetical protein